MQIVHLVSSHYVSISLTTRGTCSNKLLDTAALPRPEVVGWSGTVARKISRLFLNSIKSPEFSFLRLFGITLKRSAPCTPRDLSLAFFTMFGALLGILLGIATLPRLSLHCQLIEYPSINPWLSFHRKHIY